MTRVKIVIQGLSAEIVAGEISPEAHDYWCHQDQDTLTEYMSLDPSERDDFDDDIPEDAHIYEEWSEIDDHLHINGPVCREGDTDVGSSLQLIDAETGAVIDTRTLVSASTGPVTQDDSKYSSLLKSIKYMRSYWESDVLEIKEQPYRIQIETCCICGVQAATEILINNQKFEIEEVSGHGGTLSCQI